MREAGVRVRVTVTATMVGGWAVTGLHQPPPPTRDDKARWNHMGRVTDMERNGFSSILSPLALTLLSITYSFTSLSLTIASILMLDNNEREATVSIQKRGSDEAPSRTARFPGCYQHYLSKVRRLG